MTAAPPENFPITGLCVVADADRCPVGYDCIYVSNDRKEDCDLWKDSFFKTRVTRYICFTRIFPLDGGKLNNVLIDVCIQNEKDAVPAGFSLIDVTVDTREKATRKKQVCVKMVPRHLATDAISDLIVLSKNKRAPVNYTLVGEINGLAICYKMAPIPPETQQQQLSEIQPSPATYYVPSKDKPAIVPLKRQESEYSPQHAMSGVPFSLHPRFEDRDNLKILQRAPLSLRSMSDIENEFSYSFQVERQVALLSPTISGSGTANGFVLYDNNI